MIVTAVAAGRRRATDSMLASLLSRLVDGTWATRDISDPRQI